MIDQIEKKKSYIALAPVTKETMMKPIAKILASMVSGQISPNPTVVIVIAAQ